ncbi:MAG: gliding motility-associated C-terminal domain-containing protein, partial [Cytophagales bacterium]
ENWNISFENGSFRASWVNENFINKVFLFDEKSRNIGTYTSSINNVSVPENINCFKLAVENICGVVSDTSGLRCKILLTKDNQRLFWTLPSDILVLRLFERIGDDSLLVYSGNESGVLISMLDSSRTISSYQIVASLRNGDVIKSNILEVNRSPFVKFPNVFSPNGDGINDSFLPVYRFLEKFQIVVYDQWGGVVFSSKDPDVGWNGEKALANVPYVYVCEYELGDGKSGKLTGIVQILR